MLSIVSRCWTTLFLKQVGLGNTEMGMSAYTLRPTCFPPPGLSRSFVESLMTVVPRLYKAFAKPSSSSSKSPCMPEGGGDCEERGESGMATEE